MKKHIALFNSISQFLYIHCLKRIFFRLDPEDVHDRMTRVGIFLGKRKWIKKLLSSLWTYESNVLRQTVHGMEFRNPIGLAGGFDKNAQLIDILPSVGFGFMEVGSITGEPCAGNPKPRLWRLPKSQSLLVYYGLKNDGCEAIASRLKGKAYPVPLGINIAKTNSPETVDVSKGVQDYLKAYRAFVEADIGDYYTINISCPNVYGGEPFTDPYALDRLLESIYEVPNDKPIFLKISPDLTRESIDSIIQLAKKYGLSGFICSNLTKNRTLHTIHEHHIPVQGGLSGKVVDSLANDLISYVYKKTNGTFTIIGLGGVFSGYDAYQKIIRGASLIQLITGMIFQGPQTIFQINKELVYLIKKDGFNSVTEAIGSLHVKT